MAAARKKYVKRGRNSPKATARFKVAKPGRTVTTQNKNKEPISYDDGLSRIGRSGKACAVVYYTDVIYILLAALCGTMCGPPFLMRLLYVLRSLSRAGAVCLLNSL